MQGWNSPLRGMEFTRKKKGQKRLKHTENQEICLVKNLQLKGRLLILDLKAI